MNDSETRLIGMKPADAVKLESVPQPKNAFSTADSNKHYAIGTIVRAILQPDEILDIPSNTTRVDKRRRTDPTYTRELFYVYNWIKHCDTCLYYHQIIPVDKSADPKNIGNHTYTFWQLQPVQF